MTKSVILMLAVLCAVPAAAAEAANQQSIAASLNVYVFPSEGQAAEQQSRDEGECYQWAVANTGVDPFEASKQAAAAQEQASAQQQQVAGKTRGAGLRGAAGGAAAGALIGEVASDDAGEGAAYGAVAGAIIGRRRASSAQQQAAQQGAQQVEQASALSASQTENFKKAFSVCLEAKQYMVKF